MGALPLSMGIFSVVSDCLVVEFLVRLDLSKEERMSSTVCYKCNRTGHFARECSQGGSSSGGGGGFGGGFRGGRGGGSRGGGGDRGGFGRASCYNCNKPGHIARECPESGAKTCYNCGKNGHISRECDVADNRGSSSYGNRNRDCYSCGKSGHISRDCPDGGSGGGDSRDSRKCYACGGIGHISRDCTQSSGGGGGGERSGRDEGDDEHTLPLVQKCHSWVKESNTIKKQTKKN